MSNPDDQQTLQNLSEEYQKLQTDLQSQISTRQRLSSQQSENQSVAKEFSHLAPESAIYKLVGPVLLKQERAEAVQAVEGRLEFIGGEVKRVEKLIKELQEQSEAKKVEVYKLQMKMQEGQQA
ncbi:MAG: hypothetical protein Q9167_003759 [Letrouitia subvulpina]